MKGIEGAGRLAFREERSPWEERRGDQGLKFAAMRAHKEEQPNKLSREVDPITHLPSTPFPVGPVN